MPEQLKPDITRVTVLPPDEKKEETDIRFSKRVWNTPAPVADRLEGYSVTMSNSYVGFVSMGGTIPKRKPAP